MSSEFINFESHPDLMFNKELTRCVDRAPALGGWAAYTCVGNERAIVGEHKGIGFDPADAVRWLKGEDVDLVRIYDENGEIDGSSSPRQPE